MRSHPEDSDCRIVRRRDGLTEWWSDGVSGQREPHHSTTPSLHFGANVGLERREHLDHAHDACARFRRLTREWPEQSQLKRPPQQTKAIYSERERGAPHHWSYCPPYKQQ